MGWHIRSIAKQKQDVYQRKNFEYCCSYGERDPCECCGCEYPCTCKWSYKEKDY